VTCKHSNIDVQPRIAHMEDSGAFMLELRAHCIDCSKPFQFLGLQPGLDMMGARVSLDGLEALLAISPEGEKPSPLQRMRFGIERFNG
jgi:hypothetical protein